MSKFNYYAPYSEYRGGLFRCNGCAYEFEDKDPAFALNNENDDYYAHNFYLCVKCALEFCKLVKDTK